MAKSSDTVLSVVVPVFNESTGLEQFHKSLVVSLQKSVSNSYEIIYCDDGSTDETPGLVKRWNKQDPRVKLVAFSRNFGKEYALSAGIARASGQAILSIDGDGQHPVGLIDNFLKAWRAGSQVVVGVRTNNGHPSVLKKMNSGIFYTLFNKMTYQQLLPGSTDFRLIDRVVQKEFIKLHENDRLTRGLIDWLGFKRSYIYFEPKQRVDGEPNYSYRKLVQLAKNSFISLTPKPLYIFGILGVAITLLAFFLGLSVIIEQLILSDPLRWKFTGTAMLGIFITFLVGIVLMSQAVLSLYISSIQTQTKDRPLYIIDYKKSAGIKEMDEID
ncbi:MAG TPA: glycosyltransferase family 2 protein [Candidatus Saccharimonadales bacterium]|nr:glycosyltransferase family 2 protein [Candidatus Saccharimonadales bacterium]